MADDQAQSSSDSSQVPAQPGSGQPSTTPAPADSQPQPDSSSTQPQALAPTSPPLEDLTPPPEVNRPESPNSADSSQTSVQPPQSVPEPQTSPSSPAVEPTTNVEPIEIPTSEPKVPKPEVPIELDLKIDPTLDVQPTITDEPKTLSIDDQIKQKLKEEQDSRRQLANNARKKRKEDNLQKIMQLVVQKKQITNDEVRDFLHVSQTTATDYLSELTNKGALKREGKGRATKYS